MVSRANTVSFRGMSVLKIDVQVQISAGLPQFTIVGLADKTVAESKERIRASLYALGLALPAQRITVNLSPADLQKEGSHYDLPVALAILAAMEIIPKEELNHFIALGELALDGELVPVIGALPTALSCLERGLGLICPSACGAEAAWAEGIPILAARHLLELLNHFSGKQLLAPPQPKLEEIAPSLLDLSDVKGQETAKRGLLITAAGGHNLLLSGPPGSGKSLLAARLPTLLPPLEPQEALEVTTIHSLAGTLKEGKLIHQRPFRSPHHSCSQPALVGGGAKARPGEISLAHRGVLFLDELPEFSRISLEALRQPLENGTITISRAQAHVTYPAQVQIIAAMNPCPCGFLGEPQRSCSRAPTCGKDYLAKLSGPLIDRFDLLLEMQALPLKALQAPQAAPSSPRLMQEVANAWHYQFARQGQNILNAHLAPAALEKIVNVTSEGQSLLLKAAEKLRLTARSYQRILKVARTIADLENSEKVERPHLAEALSYRFYW